MSARDEQNLYSLPYQPTLAPTNDYNELIHKPLINGVVLENDHSLEELGINIPTKVSQLQNDEHFINVAGVKNVLAQTGSAQTDINDTIDADTNLDSITKTLLNNDSTLKSKKYDKSGGVINGDVSIEKIATGYTTAELVVKQVNSETGNNTAELAADQEGGNLRLYKGGSTARLEIDTANMDGSTGYARLMLGAGQMANLETFKFKEDGSFVDGYDNNLSSIPANIATIENGLTSSVEHKKGDFIYRNNAFYKVIAPISANDSFIIGTNIEPTTVGSQLPIGEQQLAEGAWIMRIGSIRILRFFVCAASAIASITLASGDRPPALVQGTGIRGSSSKYHCLASINIGTDGQISAYMQTQYNADNNMEALNGTFTGYAVYSV